MTAGQFVDRIQRYYGLVYSEGQQADVMAYLAKKNGLFLNGLYAATVKVHSSAYNDKNLPDIAIFEKEAVQREATTAYENAVNSRYQAIEDAGGSGADLLNDAERAEVSDFLHAMGEAAKGKTSFMYDKKGKLRG